MWLLSLHASGPHDTLLFLCSRSTPFMSLRIRMAADCRRFTFCVARRASAVESKHLVYDRIAVIRWQRFAGRECPALPLGTLLRGTGLRPEETQCNRDASIGLIQGWMAGCCSAR